MINIMKIKKTFLALTIGTLCLTTSCGSQDKENIQIKIWHYYNNEQLTAFKEIVTNFNESIGREKHIEVVEESLGYVTDLSSALINSANGVSGAESMPNMFMSYSDTAYQLDLLDKIASLNPYFTEEELLKYNDSFISEGVLVNQNELKILPVAKSFEALYINKTDFDKFISANPEITYDKLSTIEGIIEVAEIYYDYSGGKAFYGRDSLSNYFIIGAKQLGTDLFYYDDKGDFQISKNEEVYKTLWNNYYVPMVKGYFTSKGRFRTADMQNGNILCYTGSTSSSTYFPDKVIVDDDYSYDIIPKVQAAPVFQNGQPYAVSQGAGICVTKSTVEIEKACVEFLKWFTADDINENFAIKSSYLPVKKSKLNEDLINKVDAIVEKESFKVALEAINSDKLYTNVASAKGETTRNLFDKTLNETANNALNAINEMVETGISRAEAIETFITDDAFTVWYNSLIQQSYNINKR